MSMLDAFFSRGAFKAARCKTLLKLTIPRIKLLRNRREIQLKQMRKDIANLLETGQEATARIRVEHIIREENTMAAQEILELFCELLAVRLPIIEIQRECPIDLKEAISTICFAAPRCADLPELLQVQMQFAAKYGKEFVTAATELLPDSGVNRQIIELLSVRAPPVEVKMKLLKDIAEEHELDWDPAATEVELNKPHEDLLNGSSHFISGYSVPLPKEKHEELPYSTSKVAAHDKPESELENEQDSDFDLLDLPEVPKVSVLQSPPTAPNPDSVIPGVDPTLPTAAPTLPTTGPTFLTMSPIVPASLPTYLESKQKLPSPDRHAESDLGPDIVNPTSSFSSQKEQPPTSAVDPKEMNESASVFSPAKPHTGSSFIIPEVPQPQPPQPFSYFSQTKSDVKIDLNDVVAAAHNAAESAERAAAAARAAASLAQIRIAELTTKRNDHNEWLAENGSGLERSDSDTQNVVEKPVYDQHLLNEYSGSGLERSDSDKQNVVEKPAYNQYPFNEYSAKDSSIEKSKQDTETPVTSQYQPSPQTSRSTSLEDDPYFSYPNLFGRQASNVGK